MDTQKNENTSIESIPANRRILDELFSRKLISAVAREYGLQLLYPSKNWGLWISKMLMVLGVSLILSGIVYFFAFNWTKITPEMKLNSIQIAIFGCIGVAYFYGLQQLSGKVLLLSACVLVGVFLAVFGQIYQTGADAYNLFMLWALLILPWVIISQFAALWALWLVISNIFLILYWTQAVLPEREMQMMVVSYLALFNGLFLALREYFLKKQHYWLEEKWTRVILVIPILIYVTIPSIAYIIEPTKATDSIVFGALLSVIIHAVLYNTYRYKLPDMWALATAILSGCIILESAIFKALTEVFRHSDAIMYLLMGGITLGVFTLAIIKLRVIAKEMEEKNV
jgi:uncharacterized membrane protein